MQLRRPYDWWLGKCWVVVMILMTANATEAATFRVPLSPVVKADEQGEYLSAPFDLGTRLQSIDSVALEFVLPEGFELTAVSTGNSSFFRSFVGAVQDGSQLDDALSSATRSVPLNGPPSILKASPFRIPADENYRLRLAERSRYPLSLSRDLPDFLFDGAGEVTFVIESTHRVHPLPSREVVSTSTTLTAPISIESAQLVIEGIAVPEPSVIVMLFCGSLTVFATSRRST